jgi:P27 family predicted phage terminase small subunit
MGARGPAPKPTNLKLIQGTFRKDRAPRTEPQPETKAPKMPTWLNRDGKREWKRIIGELEELGLVSELDRNVLAAYCQAFGEWREHSRAVYENGTTTISGAGSIVAHPEVAMRNDAYRRMLKAAQEFGLTPSSRTRINGAEGAREVENDFMKFRTGS